MIRLLVCALLAAIPAAALDTSKLRPQGYVSDFAGVIDPNSRAAIESYLGNVERSTEAQFAVVTVKTLEDEPIEDVATRLFKEWGIGRAKTDEGLLFLLAIDDRKQRIETGYGIEPYISDGFAGGVMRSIRPILRQGDYGAAIYAAVQQLANEVAREKGVTIKGSPAPAGRPVRTPGGRGLGALIFGVIVLLFLFSLFLGGGGGRRGGRGGFGGNGGAMLAGMILGNLMSHRGGHRGWSHGGFGGGGGGGWGGGGFGGFGGGMSGGGGASGSW